MSNLIESVNAEIANNQLEEKVANIQAALHLRLKMLRADWKNLHGKTIKELHTGYGSLTVLFTDGTYIVVETEDGPLDSEIMDISKGFEHGLLSKAEHQELLLAEAATDGVRDKNTGEAALNNAIAYLGIDTVKILVNNV